MSTIGLLPEEKTRKMHGRRVSEETIYSVQTTHSNPYHRNVFLQRRANKNDTLSFKSNSGNSYVAQRVLSAKVLRVKELQNELQEVKAKLHEVMSENKLLRNLQKRQDTALSRYEDTSAALPRLLENHRAEVITLKAHAREVRAAARSLHRKLQRSEAELIHLREEHDKLRQIVEDKDLENRVELQKRVEDLEDRLNEMKEKNLNLNRKLEVEQKSHSQQLAVEISRKKNLQKELQTALSEIARLTRIIEQGQYSSRFGEGDNGSQITSITGHLTSRSTKVPQKKLGSQKNLANSKKKLATPTESKITKNSENSKGKQIKYLEERENEAETDTYVELNTKITVESLSSVSNENKDKTLAKHIVDGIKCAEVEYFHKQEDEEYENGNGENGNIEQKEIDHAIQSNILSKNNRKQQLDEKTCSCTKNTRHGKSKEILSEDEAEAVKTEEDDEEKKVTYNWDVSTSQTSCERTESKSSERPQTNVSSLDSFEVQNTTTKTDHESDSSVEDDSTIKIRIKRDLYRSRKSNAEINLDENSDSNDKIETNDSKLEICLSSYPSRYTKTTKNNLTKIQNHLDQLDDDVSSYMENKISRNKNNNVASETNENVMKQRQFEDYIKKLENIDRMNENLTSVRDQFKVEKQLDKQSQNQNNVIITSQKQYEDDSELSGDELNKAGPNLDLEISKRRIKKSSQLNANIDFSSFDPDKYLQEIDNSYKLIRQRINDENEKMNEQLQQYCKDIESDVQETNEALNKQKQNLKKNQFETEKLERDIRTNVKINDQLKLTRIDSSKKTQLLAALKAIDHGQDIKDLSAASSSIDMPETTSRRRIDKKQLMKDLFE